MWREALIVALVAGLWSIILRMPIELALILSGRESKAAAWAISIMRGLADAMYYAPIVPAAITGLLLGNLRVGLEIGATVQLMFIGVFIVGASMPPSPFLASILTTAFVILAGANTGEGIALVVPVAIFSQVTQLGLMTLYVPFVHWADGMAERANAKGIDLLNTLCALGWEITAAVPAFLGVAFGVDLAKQLLGAIPGWLSDGLGYTGGVLPALGFGMLLLIIASGEVWPFFFLGFLAATYLKVNAVAGAILGIVIALIYLRLKPTAAAALASTGSTGE